MSLFINTDIIQEIALHLPIRSVLDFMVAVGVDATSNSYVWRMLCKRDFPSEPTGGAECYKRLHCLTAINDYYNIIGSLSEVASIKKIRVNKSLRCINAIA